MRAAFHMSSLGEFPSDDRVFDWAATQPDLNRWKFHAHPSSGSCPNLECRHQPNHPENQVVRTGTILENYMGHCNMPLAPQPNIRIFVKTHV